MLIPDIDKFSAILAKAGNEKSTTLKYPSLKRQLNIYGFALSRVKEASEHQLLARFPTASLHQISKKSKIVENKGVTRTTPESLSSITRKASDTKAKMERNLV